MVELALIMPALIFGCLGVVDLLRISYFESMLQRAAADIAVQARTAPNLDFDLRDFTTLSGEFNDFKVARERAMDSGLNAATNTFSDAAIPSDAQLIVASHADDSLENYVGVRPAAFVKAAAILRPGEEVTFNWTNDYGTPVSELIKHPVIPSDGALGVPGRVAPQRMETMLDLAPIHVEVRAKIRPLLWAILGTRVVRGVATTYREKGIRRVVMVDGAGVDMAGSTATRRSGLTEVWLTSNEPLEPPLACTVTMLAWPNAFSQGWIVNTLRVGGNCPGKDLGDGATPGPSLL